MPLPKLPVVLLAGLVLYVLVAISWDLILWIVAACCALSATASFLLARFRPNWKTRWRVMLAGILPTILIVIFLLVEHVSWVREGGEGFSPIVILLYGARQIGLNLVLNFIVAWFAQNRR